MNTEDGARSLDGLARAILESYPAPTLIVDDQARPLLANRAARALLERDDPAAPLPGTHGEVLRCLHALLPGGCGLQEECRRCVIRDSVERALRSGAVHRARAFLRVRRAAGDPEVCLLVSTSPIQHQGQTLVVLTLEDVGDVHLKDEVHRAEAALRQAHQRALSLARFPEVNPDPVLRIASDLTLSYANAAALAALAEMGLRVGQPAPEELAASARRAVAAGQRVWSEARSGGRTFALSLYPLGEEVNVYGQDVTDRKLAMAELAAEKERLAVTLGSIGDAVIATDEAGRVTLMNRVAEELTGWSSGESAGRGIHEIFRIVSEETRQPAESPVLKALREGVVVGLANHTALLRKDGTERPIADSAAPIRDAGGLATGVVLVFRDQTEERRVERALRASEAQLKTIIESMDEGVVVSSLDGQLMHWNLAALAMHGFSSLDECRRELPYFVARFELADMEGAVLPLDEWPMSRVLRGETIRDLEIRVRRLDGARSRTYSYGGSLVRDRDGKPLLAVVTIRDTTERRQAEEALREADRHKGEFLGILSHELRNPLAVVRNSLDLLHQAAPGSEAAACAKAVLDRQTSHLGRLIDDLLDVTRISHGKINLSRAVIDAREVVQQACQDLRTIFLERGVGLGVEVAAEPAWIHADATRLAQVVDNLLQNAAKFTPRGGAASIAVGLEGGWVAIRVRDEGVGMEPEGIDRMFEPFAQAERSLARTQGGLGLGLPLVKGLVELHGGTVRAQSQGPGRGSEFVVLLPRAEAPPRAAAPGRPEGETVPRAVLVIEDNLDAGQTLADLLRLRGHRVEVATDGRSGIARALEMRPEVVFCDIGLPDIDGCEVAQALCADVRLGATYLVALSGYAQEADRARAAQAGFHVHLPKPASVDEILAILSKVP